MKLNFDFQIKDLEGKDMNQHAGQILANNLAGASKGDPIKYYTWAVDLFNKREIDLDKSDQKNLRDFIENNQNIFNIAKAQLLEVMDKKDK